MTPADRIAALEAEVERLRELLSAHREAYSAEITRLLDPVVRVKMMQPPGPIIIQGANPADLDAAREEAKGLREALVECAQGVDEKGDPCWCCIPSMIPYRGHDAGCEAARAALERKP